MNHAKILVVVISCLVLAGCGKFTTGTNLDSSSQKTGTLTTIKNQQIVNHSFLQGMYNDPYFPKHLVDKGKQILLNLCMSIESTKPQNLEALYTLTHAATKQFNALAVEFENNDSEIETAARDCIGEDFYFIAAAYGFPNADIEELIAPRDW
jgi:hypothetical protein